ncbi:MAG TPA: glycine/sarcosine/betaine reductase selenoprotein B family protein [Thermomicrobiales bacterium]|nr:glycine/sarcosine/betaine reductase selenoprotein B family protein [Thermomicrobiales bacterium]
MPDGVDFATLERDFVRARIYPDFAWRAYDAFSPLNRLAVPLAAARVAFVTTAGAHRPDQPPFDLAVAAGDPSYRAFPSTTPLAELVLSHRGYDTRRASADKNVVLPLDHLRAAAAASRIGSLAPTVYSFMGYIADTAPLLRESAPTVAARLRGEGADLVLLAPT